MAPFGQSASQRRQLAQSILAGKALGPGSGGTGSMLNPSGANGGFQPGSLTGAASGINQYDPASVTRGSTPNYSPPAVIPGAGGPNPSGGVYAPLGGPNADSPPAWLAKAALAAYQSGNTHYRDHLLADPSIAGNPHLKNFIVGLFSGDAGRLAEAQHYATNPSYDGWNNAAGDGIPGDGK